MWAGVCQSWVITTLAKPLAILLMTGTTFSPSLTAKLPPGRKQFLDVDHQQRRGVVGFDRGAAQSSFETKPAKTIVPRPAKICRRSIVLLPSVNR